MLTKNNESFTKMIFPIQYYVELCTLESPISLGHLVFDGVVTLSKTAFQSFHLIRRQNYNYYFKYPEL